MTDLSVIQNIPVHVIMITKLLYQPLQGWTNVVVFFFSSSSFSDTFLPYDQNISVFLPVQTSLEHGFICY